VALTKLDEVARELVSCDTAFKQRRTEALALAMAEQYLSN